MTKGQDEIQKNAESSQGGVPRIPLEFQEYESALLPLLSYVARIGGGGKIRGASEARQGIKDGAAFVLIALDTSANAILSFGAIGARTSWQENRDRASLSAGFATSQGMRPGNSTPHVTADLAANGASTYVVDWDLDPITLANAVDRRNEAIPPTAKLPPTLKVVIFYDMGLLPFRQNNFALPYASVWRHNDGNRQYIQFGQKDFSNMTFGMEVNGFPEMKYRYSLNRVYKLTLTNDSDDEFDTGCTVFEFESG
jgi:hypothetical protein